MTATNHDDQLGEIYSAMLNELNCTLGVSFSRFHCCSLWPLWYSPSLDIWHFERCVCGWSSWLTSPINSSTADTFSSLFSTRVLRSATSVPSVGASCVPNLYQ